MINNNIFVVLDFETGGLDPFTCPPIQLAALAIDPRTLKPIAGAEFCQMMCPPNMEAIQDKALAVNKKTREEIRAAPPARLVFDQFVEWVYQFNTNGKSPFTAPIPVGKNIRNFDWIILRRLARVAGLLNANEQPKFFHQRLMIDLDDNLLCWFENSTQPEKHGMDFVRPHVGLSTQGAHDALVDVKQTAMLFIEFLKTHREVSKQKKFFKNVFAGME